MAFWKRLFGKKEGVPPAEESAPPAESAPPEEQIPLWWESIQGMSGGKRVHIGHQARYLPARHQVVIEYWGEKAPKPERIPIPAQLVTKAEIVAYLQERTYVPSGTLERIRREEAAAEEKE